MSFDMPGDRLMMAQPPRANRRCVVTALDSQRGANYKYVYTLLCTANSSRDTQPDDDCCRAPHIRAVKPQTPCVWRASLQLADLRVDEDLLRGDGSVRVVVDELRRHADGATRAQPMGAGSRDVHARVCGYAGSAARTCGLQGSARPLAYVYARSCRPAPPDRSSQCRADRSQGMR